MSIAKDIGPQPTFSVGPTWDGRAETLSRNERRGLVVWSVSSSLQRFQVGDDILAILSIGNAAMDYGFMFGRSFHDLDGHIWEIIWMDPKAATED